MDTTTPAAGPTTATPWRAMREATQISLRELARRSDINPGRLSLIERGIPATAEEAAILKRILGQLLTGE